jgi:hypothetical protein
VSNRTLARSLAGSLVVLALTAAGCGSSGPGAGPTSPAPPTVVPTSHGRKPVDLKMQMLRHVSGDFKQQPDAQSNTSTGFTAAVKDDPRREKKARRTLHRDRFVSTFQRVWTGFGGSTIRIILDQFTVPGGPQAYQVALSTALKKDFGTTSPVSTPIGHAIGFTHKTKKQQTTIIMAPVGVVLMQVRATGKVALGQVARAVAVATRQVKRF